MAHRCTCLVEQETGRVHFRSAYEPSCSETVRSAYLIHLTFSSQLHSQSSVISVSEINYLCVHKKLRSKRLAPVLIKEVTRQCHLKGVFQAIYTGGVVLPTPVSVCRYNHRLLNIPKLVDTRFCYVPRHMTLARMVRLNKVASETSLPGLREMEEKDVVAVAHLYTQYMKRFDTAPLFDVDECRHQFLSGRGHGELGSGGPGRRKNQVTWSYVVEVSHVQDNDIQRLSLTCALFPRTQKQEKLRISSHSTHYPPRSSETPNTLSLKPLIYTITRQRQDLKVTEAPIRMVHSRKDCCR